MKRALLSAIVFVLTSAIGVSSAKAQINSPEDAARVCQNAPPPVWALAAIALTTLAETGSAVDYGAIAGDADGQGMSVGLMQWNFGQGTIAPLVARMENVDAVAASTMPTYGARFVAEVRRAGVPDTRAAALAWIRHTQASDNATLRREARAFFRSRESQAAQTALAQDLALDAWRYAQTWMRDVREGCNPTFAQFAVFFDYINHGGATNAAEITRMIAEYGEVRNQYTAQNRAHYSRRIALGEVTWIMGFPHERPCAIPSVERGGGAQAHVWDAQANCQIWRQTVEGGAEVGKTS